MFYEFLKVIQAGEVQSLLEIARTMKVSPNMVLQIAQDLTRRGYLQEVGMDCNTPQTVCTECPANSVCRVPVRHWFLTEKGRIAASAQVG